MFKELKSEAILTFDIVTESPLYIKSGEDNSLDPSAVDGKYITIFRNGKYEPFIPGTSLKGAFRCRAERLLRSEGSCDIINRKECVPNNKEKPKTGLERYKKSCPICRLFGSNVLKSRITFSDAYVEGEYKEGKRTCVAIDRLTGASKQNALYDMEYIEKGKFKEKIVFQNFEPYQINLIISLIKEMNEGFLTLGGLTSKGFGCVSAENLKLTLKYYNKNDLTVKGYERELYYNTKTIEGENDIFQLVKGKKFKGIGSVGDIDEAL